MKIGFPINERCKYASIFNTFARAKLFLVYDTNSDEYTFIDNDASNQQGGAGIKAAQLVLDNNIDSLILPRCGENAFKVLDAGNVKVYQMNGSIVEDNIKALLNDELKLLKDIHSGFHGNVPK